jgi:MSHA biogenesis protein MshM
MHKKRVPTYLQHRLLKAAVDEQTDAELFTPRAALAIAHYSGGVPRLINVIAHKCLMLAYGEGVHRVTLAHVHLAAKDTPGVRASKPRWLWLRPVWTPKVRKAETST